MSRLHHICFFSVLMIFAIPARAQAHIRIDSTSTVRSVCGLAVAKIHGLVIVARPIDPDTLHSRVDNESYAVCPYLISLQYAGRVMRLDFGADVTLKHIRNDEYDHVDVIVGHFELGERGWRARDIKTDRGDALIYVRDSLQSVSITGSFSRKGSNQSGSDYCVAISVVGNRGFAATGLCAAEKSMLSAFDKLVDERKIFWFED